jgi:hypothetical protein
MKSLEFELEIVAAGLLFENEQQTVPFRDRI